MKKAFSPLLKVFVPLSLLFAATGCEKEEPSIVPTLVTSEVRAITKTTAIAGGDITSDGNEDITARGVVWSLEATPDLSLSTKTSEGSGVGSFISELEELEPGTKYFVRAYATNNVGTAYGNEVTFETMPLQLPVIETNEATNVTFQSATLVSVISSAGAGEVTERGVVYGTAALPTTADVKVSAGTGAGEFSVELIDLEPETKYFARAYGINSDGTGYGNQVVIETGALQAPTVSTGSASEVTTRTVKISGSVVDGGTAAVTARGIAYGTEAAPTVAGSKSSNGTGVGTFSAQLAELTPGTVYFARAYATNEVGTSYGSEITFTTLQLVLPVATTGSVSAVSFYSATVAGTVTSEGTSPVTVRGFVYSTSPNSTTGTSLSATGTGTGSFSVDITGLAPNTKYYIKTFATSSDGTGYGAETSFTTRALVPLPGSFSGNWYNVAGTWIWAIAENTTGKYIRTNNVLYYYQPSDVDVTDNVYQINGTSSTGAKKTAYLKQGTDTNKITISTTSAASGFIEYGQVVGRTVKRVTHSSGSFQVSSGTAWIEKNSAGATIYNFTEISRDDWSVYLRDNDGRGDLQIDVHRKTTFWTPTGAAKFELYPLTGMFNE